MTSSGSEMNSQMSIIATVGKKTASTTEARAMVCTTPQTVAFFDSLK